jgi:aldose 1-epimerase
MVMLEVEGASAEIIPEAGGRVGSLIVHGHQLLVGERQAAEAMGKAPGSHGWGMFPMAPWAGRIRRGRFEFDGRAYQLPINHPPHAIHGIICDRPAEGTEVAGSAECVLTWTLGPPWPFAGQVIESVALAEDGLLVEIEITADEAMPVTAGWHPWWIRRLASGEVAELDFQPMLMYARDPDGIPTGELVPPSKGPWDDCFVLPQRPIRIRWPGALELTLETDCPDVVVFTEPVHAICVEPQSGPPDAVNSAIHLAIVEPGQKWLTRARWTWRQL